MRRSKVLFLPLLAGLVALVSSAARAADYTDLWWTPTESGWGVNVVHTDNFMFLTFFIYDANHNPTWYIAGLAPDSNGAFSGALYLTHGTFYALQWNRSDSTPAQQVGNVSFSPSSANNYQATLMYTVDGVGTVTKAIERQPLTAPIIGGSYTGGISAAQTGCNNSSRNGAYKLTYDLLVAQSNAGAATFVFTYPTYACTLSGNLVQHGRQYTISGAAYQCTQNGQTIFSGSANLSEIVATSLGIEGRWLADTGFGCRETAHFSAVLQ